LWRNDHWTNTLWQKPSNPWQQSLCLWLALIIFFVILWYVIFYPTGVCMIPLHTLHCIPKCMFNSFSFLCWVKAAGVNCSSAVELLYSMNNLCFHKNEFICVICSIVDFMSLGARTHYLKNSLIPMFFKAHCIGHFIVGFVRGDN
jgi:hypothetical protein